MRDGSPADLEGVISTVHPVMAALARGVPLTLLMDLAEPSGPDSRTVLATEAADLGWLRDLAFPAQRAGTRATDRVSDRATG